MVSAGDTEISFTHLPLAESSMRSFIWRGGGILGKLRTKVPTYVPLEKFHSGEEEGVFLVSSELKSLRVFEIMDD